MRRARRAAECRLICVFTSTQSWTARCPNDEAITLRKSSTQTSLISQSDADEKAARASRESAEGSIFCGGDLHPFDFAVIRYHWTDANGRDLDSRTAIIAPDRSSTDLGWARNISDPPTGSAGGCQVANLDGDPNDFYLVFSGDFCGTDGEEDVLVNFAKLKTDFPDQTEFRIRLRANWYHVEAGYYDARDKTARIEFDTYLGGTMQKDGYVFSNVGGSPVQQISVLRHFDSNVQSDVDGDALGTLVFDPVTNTAQILSP